MVKQTNKGDTKVSIVYGFGRMSFGSTYVLLPPLLSPEVLIWTVGTVSTLSTGNRFMTSAATHSTVPQTTPLVKSGIVHNYCKL